MDNWITINVSAAFAYETDSNGFGGPSFAAGDYRGGDAFSIYRASGSELQISKSATPLEFATYGLLSEAGLCFYAVAPEPTVRPASGQISYSGFADGISQIDGDADRLYRSTFIATYNAASNTYSVQIGLMSVEDGFAEPANQAQQLIGNATATLTYQNGIFNPALLAGPPGYSGIIGGSVGGPLGIGATFYFELSDNQGNRIWGVAAADGAQI